MLASCSTPAIAQTAPDESRPAAPERYRLPPAALADTLEAIAAQSGATIRYRAADVGTLRSGAVTGELTVSQAIAVALSGTGLSARRDNDGGLTILSAVQTDEIVVVAPRDEAETGFKASRSETATRSGASLREIPGSVTVITSKVLETQQAMSVRDALGNASGLTFEESPQGSPTVSVRGFGSTSITVNGVSEPRGSQTNVFGIERIEVLKGPQAILSGANSLGGGVNIVTRKPQAETSLSAMLQYGSYGDKTGAIDVGGGLAGAGKLSVRLIASAAHADDSPGGFEGREDYSVLPQLRFNSGGTDLVVGASYGKQYSPLPRYTFARLDGEILDPPSVRLGAPDDGFRSEQRRVFYELEQSLSSQITLISRLQYSRSKLDLRIATPFGLDYDFSVDPPEPTGFAFFFSGASIVRDKTLSGDHYLRISGSTGAIKHNLSFGLNHTSQRSVQTEYDGGFTVASIYPPDPDLEFPRAVIDPSLVVADFASRGSQVAVFAQDLMSWRDFNLLVNLRRTAYSRSSVTSSGPGGQVFVTPKETDYHTTPGVGLVYKVTPQLSIYASYAEGYSPVFSTKCGGGVLDPTETTNREIGAKFDFAGGKLSLTAAAFKLDLSNALQFDFPNRCFNQLSGQTTRGLEVDLQGEIMPGWNIIANYTYNDLEDASDPTRLFPGLPAHKYSVWTTYDIGKGALRGMGFGLGVTGSGPTDGTSDTMFPFRVPAQARVDLSLFYTRGPWTATLGVRNVLDKRLYGAVGSAVYVPIEEPRTVLVTLKRKFR